MPWLIRRKQKHLHFPGGVPVDQDDIDEEHKGYAEIRDDQEGADAQAEAAVAAARMPPGGGNREQAEQR